MASLARRLLRQGAKNAPPPTLTGIVRNADSALEPLAATFRRAPDDAFRTATSGATVSKAGDSAPDVAFAERSANHRKFFSSTGFPAEIVDDVNIVRQADNISASRYPDNVIRTNDDAVVTTARELQSGGLDTGPLAATTDTADVPALVNTSPFFKNFDGGKLLNSLVSKGSFKTITKATIIVAAGVGLAFLIQEAMAKSSGCFLYQRDDSQNVSVYRVLGYTCGDVGKEGDDAWTRSGLPVKPHPFEAEVKNVECNPGDICRACDMVTLAAMDDVNIEEMPENQTLVCHKATVLDVLTEMIRQSGRAVREFIGAAAGGLFGAFDVVALAVAAAGGLGSGALAKVANKRTTDAVAWVISVIVGVIVAVLLYVLVRYIRKTNSSTATSRSARSTTSSPTMFVL